VQESTSQSAGAPLTVAANALGTPLNGSPPKYFRIVSLKTSSALALCLGTLIITAYGLSQGSLVTLVAYATFGLVGLAFVWRLGVTPIRIYITIYGCAVVAAVVLAWIYSSAYGTPYFEGGSDDLHYETMGIAFAHAYGIFDYDEIRGGLVGAGHNSVGYVYLVGLMVKFSEWFGDFHTMVPRLFNASCLALVSVLVFQLGEKLDLKKRTAVAAAFFAGLLPLMMWISVQTFRDIILTLFLLLLAVLWIPDRNDRWRYPVLILLVLSALLIVPLWEMRKGQAFVAILFIVYSIIRNRNDYSRRQFILMTMPIAVFVTSLITASHELLTLEVIGFISQIELYSEYRSTGDIGGGLSLVVFETPLFPLGWVYRMAYLLITPIPVVWKPVDTAWQSLGVVIHILFLPFLWIGLKRAIRKVAWQHVVVIFAGLFTGVAIFTFQLRQISQYLPFAILIAALGYEQFSGDPRRVILMMGGVSSLLGLIFLVLKGLQI
jgi:hypothetical protein